MLDFIDTTTLTILWFSITALIVACFILGSLDSFDEISGSLIFAGIGLVMVFVFILTPTLVQAGMTSLVSTTLISLIALGFLASLVMMISNVWSGNRRRSRSR